MHIFIAFLIAVCVFAGFHPPLNKNINEIDIDVGAGYPVLIHENVKPLQEFLDRNLVHQRYDYSCGSAALATLLKYYLGEDLTELQVIRGLMRYGDKNKIMQRRAFSLLDMKKFVSKLGYKGIGYKAKIDDLYELNMPCLVPIQLLGYRHFTVLRGIKDGHVFLADPFKGNTSYALPEFESMWYENVIFVVYPKNEVKTLNALKLKDSDLRYINEFSHLNILDEYGPKIPVPDQKHNDFMLPDGYEKYYP